MRATLLTGSISLVLFGLTGCAGSGEGLDENGRPNTPGSATGVLTADYQSIQDNVFTPICTVCHAGATAPLGLRLDQANAYTLLVGVASVEVPGLQRIRPGNPDTSYLIQKIQGNNAVGERMPRGGPYLPQSTIDIIRQWVANGAPRSMPSGASGASSEKTGISVATTAPVEGAQIDWSLGQIVVGFDRELDANLVNASTVSLVNTKTNMPVLAKLTVPLDNPSTLLVAPLSPLANGSYRLDLRGAGGGALAGLDAMPLNSKSDASFMKSSDAGTDFSLGFSVEVRP